MVLVYDGNAPMQGLVSFKKNNRNILREPYKDIKTLITSTLIKNTEIDFLYVDMNKVCG